VPRHWAPLKLRSFLHHFFKSNWLKNVDEDEIRKEKKTKTHHLRTSRVPDTSKRIVKKKYTREIQIHLPFLQEDNQSFSGY
jgi:hypothetical protein